MCCKYWPPELNMTLTYGGIKVTVVHELKLASFTVRTIRLSLAKYPVSEI